MFFDIGMGLLLTAIIGWATGTTPSVTFVIVGIVGCLWPDLDVIVWKLRGKKMDHHAHEHRDLLHKPWIIGLPLTAIVWFWFGWQVAVLFGINSLVHFFHDTPEPGWGIQWGAPFDWRYWAYRSYGTEPLRLYAWTKAEQDELCEKYGNPNWFKETYGRLSPTLILELCLLVTGLVSLTLWYLSTLS